MFPLCIKWASLAFLAASPVAAYEFKWDLEERWAAGGGDTPLYKPYRYVPPPKGMVFAPFWSENRYRL